MSDGVSEAAARPSAAAGRGADDRDPRVGQAARPERAPVRHLRSSDYVLGVDVGGTCTDCVVFRQGEPVRTGKVFSTPPHFAQGVIDSVAAAAAELGLTARELLAETGLFLHGSTVVDNTILTQEGARVGLLTTAGFEDTLLVTRGAYGRWGGLTEERIKHPVMTDRPEPLVPAGRIIGLPERVDWKGAVVESLNEAAVEAAVRHLVETEQVDAIAVCLLWSFRNPAHELAVRDIIRRIDPELHVSLSCEVAPVPGEYERTSTTVINAYAGDITASYLGNLSSLLSLNGFEGQLLVMQGFGGLVDAGEAAVRPVTMLECGPAAGVIGSRYLGGLRGDRNIIAADMGGTTFKVGIIQDGEIDRAREPIIDRYHYAVPKIEVVSIGAGGGSIVALDPLTGTPRVGPSSAGSVPGPICYGRGGTEPTLTDVACLLGFMDPGSFLGGSVALDIEAARSCFEEKIARPMGMSVEKAAIGIYKIASAQIADLIREVTVERGLDPRDFVIHAFGGSCGLFASAFAKDLAVSTVFIPQTASVNCAFGLVSADVTQEYSVAGPLTTPTASHLNELAEPLLEKARANLGEAGFELDDMRFDWSFDLRYRRQVHQVTTPLAGDFPLGEDDIDTLITDFERLYERRYGKGSAYRHAGIEITSIRLKAFGGLARPVFPEGRLEAEDPSPACVGERAIYVDAADALVPAPIYRFDALKPGNAVAGPAVIQTPITTIVVQSAETALMDAHRNITIEVA